MSERVRSITTVLHLGAGVQSSTVALMAANGELDGVPDVAVFADTGWEPRAVYEWLEWLETQLPFPVERVSGGDLREEQMTARVRGKKSEGERFAALPYYVDTGGEREGMVRRQCTKEYKIEPIERFIRQQVLGLKPRQRAPKEHTVDSWFGISYDEIQRMKVPFAVPWQRNVYPLVERRMTRGHCLEWMQNKGYPKPPRSACLGCPYHSDEEWLAIKNGPADEWQSVVDFDRAIRSARDMRGTNYLHRSLKPIDEIDFQTAESAGQMSLLDECEGYCGV